MEYKLGRILKKICLSSLLVYAFNMSAKDPQEKQNFTREIVNSSHDLSTNNNARIYNINASRNGLSLKGSRIDKPTESSLNLYKDPSRYDKYVIKILDKNSKVIGLIGLRNPFYLHLQHIGYEDSNVFGGYIDYNFDIPVSLNSNAKYLSFNRQNEFGLNEINKIQLNNSKEN